MASQAKALLAGFGWSTFGQIAKFIIQLGGIAIMTRLLPPSDFGLVALASVFTAFAAVIQDFGTSVALVQRKEINQQLISTTFWMNILIGLILCLAIAGVSPLAAHLMQEPRLTNVLLALSVVFPISTAGAMHRAMLQREKRFKTLVRQEITNGLCSLTAGIVAANLGFGVYSLVVQTIVTVAVSTAQSWLSNKARPHLEWSHAEFRQIWHFTAHLVVFRCLTYFTSETDNLLIGRFLGSIELAWYSMANRITTVPVQAIGQIVYRVMLPHFSRDQDDPAKIGREFVTTLSLLTALCLPAFALAWGLREPMVDVLFGDGWATVADVLAWTLLIGMLRIAGSNTTTLLTSLGNTRQLRNTGIVSTIVLVLSFFLGVPFGIVGVAIARCAATLFVVVYTLHISLRLVGQSVPSLARSIWRQILFSVMAGGAAWMADIYLADAMPSFARLVLIGACGSILYLGLIGLFARDLVLGVLHMRRDAGGNR